MLKRRGLSWSDAARVEENYHIRAKVLTKTRNRFFIRQDWVNGGVHEPVTSPVSDSERLSSLKNEMSDLRVANALYCNRKGYTARSHIVKSAIGP